MLGHPQPAARQHPSLQQEHVLIVPFGVKIAPADARCEQEINDREETDHHGDLQMIALMYCPQASSHTVQAPPYLWDESDQNCSPQQSQLGRRPAIPSTPHKSEQASCRQESENENPFHSESSVTNPAAKPLGSLLAQGRECLDISEDLDWGASREPSGFAAGFFRYLQISTWSLTYFTALSK